jgi:hypothetical protein
MSERLRELLMKAVRELEPAEQEEVLGELLVGSTAQVATLTPGLVASRHSSGPRRDRAELMEWASTMAVASGDMKLLPVRLPSADYERLRTWSREHGFSMAVIIRTLVERFLNEQGQPAPASPPDAAQPDEAPVDEAPVDEAPVDEAPVDEVQVDEASVD